MKFSLNMLDSQDGRSLALPRVKREDSYGVASRGITS